MKKLIIIKNKTPACKQVVGIEDKTYVELMRYAYNNPKYIAEAFDVYGKTETLANVIRLAIQCRANGINLAPIATQALLRTTELLTSYTIPSGARGRGTSVKVVNQRAPILGTNAFTIKGSGGGWRRNTYIMSHFGQWPVCYTPLPPKTPEIASLAYQNALQAFEAVDYKGEGVQQVAAQLAYIVKYGTHYTETLPACKLYVVQMSENNLMKILEDIWN